MRNGDVWWAETPDFDRRPVLILTRSEAIPILNSVVVAPATTTVRAIPTELLAGIEDGLPQDGAFSFDNVGTVPKSMLVERITNIGHRMPEACRALAAATDC